MSSTTKKPNLVLTRLIDAPRERVFKAWIDPEQFAYWWGPHTFTTPRVKLDARVGGKIDIDMAGAKGSPWEKPYPMHGEFTEVSRYDRLAFTAKLPDGKGGYGLENLNEVTFADKGAKTELTLSVTTLFAAPEMAGALSGMKEGWSQSLERLDSLSLGRIEKHAHLAASPSRVWKALTDHLQFGDWFGVKLDEPFTVGRTSTGRITHPGYEHVEWKADIIAIEPEKRFAFAWHPYGIDPKVDYTKETPTTVEFRLEKGPAGAHLIVTESGFDEVPAARRAEAFKMDEKGWAAQMENIAAHLAKNP
jgi:uncharacterized protein YndB with AHSA1/START domain